MVNYTVCRGDVVQGTPDKPGLVPQALKQIFQVCHLSRCVLLEII